MENKDLKFIKKFYGEKMMHLCREFFPTILDKEGKLSQIMKNNFAPTKALYDELIEQEATEDFRNFIVSLFDEETKEPEEKNALTPSELLDKAGYILYPECQTEEEIQSFKKYYAPGEVLCTFRGDRLHSCRVWFAVKKNVDQIKRENFENPEREDEYGTSVISIQFSRQGGWLSIKNRYNHAVKNPDSTFGNRLDNIIPGLDNNFREYFNLPRTRKGNELEILLRNFVLANDNKYYHVNLQIDNFYFCEDNIIVSNGTVTQFDKDSDILIDNILINKRRKKIEVLSALFDYEDSCLDDIGKIEKIDEIKKEHGEKDIVITNINGQKITFTINRYNQIIGYANENIEVIGDNFFRYNKHIQSVYLPNVRTIGNNFLENTRQMFNIDFPNVEIIGDDFMQYCNGIEILSMPLLREVGDNFLKQNRTISEFIAPQLSDIGDNFLIYNIRAKKIYIPSVAYIGDNFMANNEKLENIDFPNLIKVGERFLISNKKITVVDLPNLEICGTDFMAYNQVINKINIPNIQICGNNFLMNNFSLLDVDLPSLQKCGDGFIFLNSVIKKISMPNLEQCGAYFLSNNLKLKEIDLPKLKIVGDCFLENNDFIQELSLPNLRYIGHCFMSYNESVKLAKFPRLMNYGKCFLDYNKNIKIYAPNSKNKDKRFVNKNKEEDIFLF